MNLDRIKAGLAAFIDAYLGRRLTYFGLYPSTVVDQGADGRVEVLPDDEAVRGTGIGLVELRNGAPGYRYEIPVGARCLVGFEAGDPSRPYLASWEPEGGADLLTFDNGSQSIARVDDSTIGGYLVQDPGTFVVYYAPDVFGVPGVYSPLPAPPVPPNPPPPGFAGLPIAGVITTGNDKLKA